MGLIDDLGAKLARLKEATDARRKAMAEGRPAKVLTADEMMKGHPKVSVRPGFQSVVYETRLGSCFGWFWLIFTCVHCIAMFYGLSHGSMKFNKTLVAHASWWHYLVLAAFYVPFFLVGFAFTIARYRVELSDDQILVRWRILPCLGWTWKLSAGDEVKVVLAFRGSSQNKRPVDSIVVSSQGNEIDFGAFLAEDIKEHLAGAIRHYYGETPSAEPFLAPPEAGR